MNPLRITQLIEAGATHKVRAYLKRLALKERLPVLHDCIPYVNTTPTNLRFFQENFAQEIGALISEGYDYTKAEALYRAAKALTK